MGFVLNGSAAVLWAAASVSLVTAVAAWTRRDGPPGGRQFALMMVCVVIWNLMAGMEAAAVDLPAKVLFSKIGYIGISGVVPLFLRFSMAYAGKEWRPGGLRSVLIWVVPAATLLLVFSNDAHHLVWTGFDWVTTARGRVLLYGHGPWYWFWVAYYAVASLFSVGILMQAAFQCRKLYIGQTLVLFFGAVLPWIGEALYVSGANPFPGLDLPTIGFAGMGVLVLVGISRFALFDIVPVARTALVERMEDGVIVLDLSDRVIDINPAAQKLLRIAPGVISRPGTEVLAALSYLLPRAALGGGEYQADVRIPGNPLSCIELLITPLRSTGTRTGRMIILHDVTLQRIAEQERDRLITELQTALADVKTLRGLLPICASCKKIRDDNGYWQNLERYLQEHSEAQFSHGICDDCIDKLYPELSTSRPAPRT